MLRKLQLLFSLAFVFLCSASFADQITLKNGDRLTGTVVKGDGKSLVLHTEAAGDITIQLSSIQNIKTEQALHLGLKNGKTVVGPVTSTDGKLEVATKNAGTVEAPVAEITVIRNDAEQTAFDKSQHPGLLHGWTGGANVGFSIARGNSETDNLALAFNATHTSVNDKIALYESSIVTKNDLATPSTVANLNTGGIRIDHNLNPRVFVFVAADFMSNALQFLDLRGVYGGGFGVHVIKNDKTQFDVLGGLNYTHETYSNGPLVAGSAPPVYVSYGVTNRFVALTLAETLTQSLGKSTVLTQSGGFFPDLQHSGQYRGTFNLGTVTKLKKWLGWQNQFNDIYVSNPPIGTKTNDLILTTGLNMTFSH